MKESELNTIIKNNFSQNGWGWKLPDPSKENIVGVDKNGKTVFNFRPNPFDGLGITNKFIVFFETKLLKGYQAFSFRRIAQHQIFNLDQIHETTILHLYDFIFPLFICGIYIPYKGVDLFFFHVKEILIRRARGDKSVKKKELLILRDKGFYLPVKKKNFQVDRIPEVIINGEII